MRVDIIIYRKMLIPSMEKQSDLPQLYNSNNKEMREVEAESDVVVQPQNAIVFYRNQFQSAATISITRRNNVPLRYSIKTTNKKAYRVSSSEGEFRENEERRYIDIMIDQNTPLEQCLMDRFKLILIIDGRAPTYKTFKVIINYKKDSKIKESNLNYLQTSSRASGSIASTAATTILGHPLPITRRSHVRPSKILSYVSKQGQTQRNKLKQEIEKLVKQVQQSRLRFQYLQQQHVKKAFRKKIGCYFTVFTVVCCFLIGMLLRKAAHATLQHFEYSL